MSGNDHWPRVAASERLRHKVLISLNDEQYEKLLDEARARNLAPSIVARLAFVEGLPEIRRKRQASCRQPGSARRQVKGGTA